MAFDTVYYSTGYMIKDRSLNTYDPGVYDATITTNVVTSGIDLTITIRNRTTTNQFAPTFVVDLGWGTTGISPPTHMCLANPSFRRQTIGSNYEDSSRSNAYGDNVFNSPSGINGGLNIPAICWDNSTGCIGFATNYGHICQLRNYVTTSGRYGLWLESSYTLPAPSGSYNPPTDWLSSGETVSYKIWLRLGSGTISQSDISLPLATQAPFVDWYKTTIGNNRPPRVAGRIYGLLFANNSNGSNPRGFVSRNGVRVDTATGWFHLLDAHLNVTGLKASGYTGAMLWALNGYDFTNPYKNYVPTVWTDFPSGVLSKDLHNLKRWQEENTFDIYVWVGHAFMRAPSGLNYDADQHLVAPPFAWISGDLMPQWSLASATKPTGIDPVLMSYIKKNIHDGPLVYCKGVGLDFAPNHAQFQAITGIYHELRHSRPGKIVFTEGLGDCITQGYVSSMYTSVNSAGYSYKNQFDLVRCPLQDLLTPGYQNYILYSEPTPPGLIASGELAGHCIVGFSSTNNGIPTGMETTNYPSSGILAGRDPYTQNPRPRFLR